MDKKNYSEQKSAAHTFFAESKIVTPPSDSFKEELRQKILSHYITFNDKNMDETKKSFISRPKPILLIGGFFAVMAIIAGGFILSSSLVQNHKSNANLGAEIALIEGNLEYKSGTADWIAANNDSVLKEGDSVRLVGEGKAIVNIDDGSSIRLNNDSGITLSSLNPDHVVITNDNGEVYTRVVKSDRVFEVVAKGVTYKSLGTAYKTINTETQNGVEVFHSQVSILGIDSSDSILVQQGQKYFVVNTAEPELQNKVIEVNADDIKKDDFAMWNKEKDEQINEFKDQMGVLFDLVPPALTLTNPTDGSKTQNDKITVSGTTEADASLTINDQAVENNEGSFSLEIALNMGANGIKVIATDPSGNKTVNNLTITRESVPAENPQTNQENPYIWLSGTTVDNGISFTWAVNDVDVSMGFKLVKNTSGNPVYPGNDYQYLSNSDQRNYTWEIKDGVTYHFRVCQYLGGSCGVYSNDITVAAPTTPAPTSSVSSISLIDNGDSTVSWFVDGYSSQGFKVVWSKNSGPTYPNRSGDDYQYFSSPDAMRSDELSSFSGSGTYYVRVCEYLGGACGVYSNEITVDL